MSLKEGQMLGPYRIAGALGSGGMGEVYRARDTRLDRDVAVKVLPPRVATDPDALARFEREAKAVAALSHPNILAIHDFQKEGEQAYAVTELLEGETLRDRLEAGVLPLRKAVEIARQVADGLGAAHEKGVVHRDLKPDNLFLTKDGRAKILDFGLAVRAEMPAGDDTRTPTRTNLTEPGSVLGTVGYMSPEQVRGQSADGRSDIFSFGAILYEMLTGRRAFERETAAESMTAILREEPEDAAGDAPLPPALGSIVRRCLEKRPEERFHSARDLGFALEAAGGSSSTAMQAALTETAPAAATRSVGLPVIGAAILLAGLAFVAGRWLAPPAGPGAPTSFRLDRLTYRAGVELFPNLAPDGGSFVYVAPGENGDLDIFSQRVGGQNAVNLTADSPLGDWQPAFSPDGGHIAFASARDGGGIFIMGATGESVRRLTDFGFNPSWSPDGTSILVASEPIANPFGRQSVSRVTRVDVASGEQEELDLPDAVQPRTSPDGSRITFWGLPAGSGRRVIYTAPSSGGEAVPVVDDGFMNWNPVWSPDGRSLYFASDRGGAMNLWRVAVDPGTGRAQGTPRVVSLSTQAVTQFDMGPSGQIALATLDQTFSLKRRSFNLEDGVLGEENEILVEGSRSLTQISVSPDERWVAMQGADRTEDLFLVTTDGTGLRRLTDDAHRDRGPAWGPDSDEIFFFSDRSGHYDIWSIRRDGSRLHQVTDMDKTTYNPSISPDGRWLLSAAVDAGPTLVDLTAPRPVTEGVDVSDASFIPAIESGWSPDSKSIAGTRDDRPVIYSVEDGTLREFPHEGFVRAWLPDGRLLCASEGGMQLLDPDTGESRTLPTESAPVGSSRVTPSHVYEVTTRGEGDIWLLEPEAPAGG